MKTKHIVTALSVAILWAAVVTYTRHYVPGEWITIQSATQDQINSVQPRYVFEKAKQDGWKPRVKPDKPEGFDGWEGPTEEELDEYRGGLREEQKTVNPIYVFTRLNKDKPQKKKIAKEANNKNSGVSTIKGKEADENNYIKNDAQINWVPGKDDSQKTWTSSLLNDHIASLNTTTFSTKNTKVFLEVLYKKLSKHWLEKQQNILIAILKSTLFDNYDRLKNAWVDIDEVTTNVVDALWELWVWVDIQVKREIWWSGTTASSSFKMGIERTTGIPSTTDSDSGKEKENKKTETTSDTTKTVSEADMKKAQEQKEALSTWSELKFVAQWKDINWVSFSSIASWIATNKLVSRKSQVYAEFIWLPDLPDTMFYEGWIVRWSPSNVVSTWEVKKSNGKRTNSRSSRWNLSDHEQYILTLEKRDGNSAPADHIFEGKF